MPIGVATPTHICQEILLRFDRIRKSQLPGQPKPSIREACRLVAEQMNMAPSSVYNLMQRLRPTTNMAKLLMAASSVRLVKRFVKKASPAEILDVLSRPGIDVLAPAKKGGNDGSQGFVLSVLADSCGAVKVGVATGQVAAQISGTTPEPDPALGDSDDDFIDFDEKTLSEGVSDAQIPEVLPLSPVQVALQRARDRLHAARTQGGDVRAERGSGGEEDEGVQVRDEQPRRPKQGRAAVKRV